ncbi:hypothetical protein [Sporosarcina pasteurii]|uniref:Uncharacterized protein n=1 Tax=Sporosarcina pasteurii TaxID=1474 RepID=A0A380C7L6_SPOPA|nr:hypothetical protein [Sporosarcina pasteurii]MDS9473004.1 hypothetical protein [Sporosarcina pasteurii]QBQ04514.1 hypothetical protein E2C16_01925 [Sporosarcina pasteurii]SUJ14336.1 Uncharacterised protein [Sporosarcina pasteurii]
MAKKDNKSHHDRGVKLNINRQEHSNSFIQHRDPRLNQQEIARQNLAQNHKDGNENYQEAQMRLAEAAEEFERSDFSPEDRKQDK